MVSAAGIVHDNAKAWRLVQRWPGESPYSVQLMGGDPDEMAAAVAAVAQRIQPDCIDLNLGCPSPHVLRSCAGGFLLRDPKKAGRVIAAAVDAASATATPVTVKLRLGHDERHLTYLDVGAEAQAAGAAWCTLHGRTVEQGYSGHADWSAIGRLVDALDIPVVGNGDLRAPADVVRMRDDTGSWGFFIARAAMHDPTIFRRMRAALDGQPVDDGPDLGARVDVMREYLRRADAAGGIPLAVLKRQAVRFLAGAPGAKRLRAAVHDAADTSTVAGLLEVAQLHGDD